MSAIIGWLIRGLQFGGPVFTGYIFNDFAAWVGNFFADKGVDVVSTDSAGKPSGFKTWFVALVSIVLGIALYLVLKVISGFKKGKKSAFIIAALAVGLSLLFPDLVPFEIATASILFTAAASVTTTYTVPYLPEYITFVASTVPTSLIIDVKGIGNVVKLDGTGVTNLNGQRMVGELAANTYVFQVADGYVGSAATFTFANAVASDVDVMGFSDSQGTRVVLHQTTSALANIPTQFSNFLYLAMPSVAATDVIEILYASGKQDNLNRLELAAQLAYTQEVSATRYNADNYDGRYAMVQLIPGATQSVYYTQIRDL